MCMSGRHNRRAAGRYKQMSTEVAASVLLPKPRSVVRQYLIGRWVEPDITGVVEARVTAGGVARSGPASTVLPAFDAEVSGAENLAETAGPQAFEVQAHGVLWRYVVVVADGHTTRLNMAWVQANWIGRLPGIRTLMAKGMEREKTRLARWAEVAAK